MANACGGQEVSQNSIKLNSPKPKKVNDLTIKFVSDYNAMMKIAMETIADETKLEEE